MGRVYDPILSVGSVFILDAGATLEIGNIGGISTGTTADTTVAINFGGSYTYSTGANYMYIGNANQVTGNGLSQNTPANVTINNPGNIVTLSNSTNMSGILTVTAGSTFALTTNNLGATTAPSSVVLYDGAATGSSITGTGTLTLGGDVTVNNAGTGSNGATISAPVALGATRTITVADGSSAIDLAASGVISGAYGITKAGAGLMNLSGANTYTGLTIINAGTLQLGAAGGATNTPLGTTAAGTTVAAGAALDLNGFTLGTAEPLTLNGTGISAGGALTNSSATAVSYSGLITLGSASSIITNAGDINITNVGTITGGGFGLTMGGSGNGSVSSIIGTGAGTVTKIGTGTWTLSGSSTYTGLTTISAGTLKLGAAGGATNTPLGTTGSGTTVTTGAVLDLNGFTLGTAEPLTLNGTGISAGGALTNSSATAVSYSGLITLGSASSIIANAGDINITNAGTIMGATFDLTLGGSGNGSVSSIIGTGTGTVTKIGTGTWTLSGSSTYTGLTTISAGMLKLGAAGGATNTPLGTTGSGTTVTAEAVLDLNGFTLGTAEPLTLNGTGISNGGALINSSATAVSYNGAITLGSASSIGGTGNITLGSNGITGGFDLTKVGSAILNLGTGTATLGSLTISLGTLTSTTGTLFIAGNFNNSGTFANNSGIVNFNGAGAQTVAGTASTTYNNLIFSNSGTKTLTAPITVSGNLSISNGVVADLVTYTSTTNTLTLGGSGALSGSWGSSGSPATNKNDTYFTYPHTGILNVTTSTCVGSPPSAPGSITGTITQCPGLTGQTYSISAVANANTYIWTVPAGWSITAGAGTTNLTVTTGSTGQNGSITVAAGNSCGTSTPSSLAVIVVATPATPGAITGTATQCPGLINQTYSISAVTYATTYTWTVPTGWSITAGGGTTSITVTTGSAGQNGSITVTAGNSCGTSAPSSLAVTVSPATPATPGAITGTATQCPGLTGQIYSISAVTNATTYTWTVPTGWSITAGGGTTSITVTTGSAGQNGSITVTAGNSCGTSAPSSMAVTVLQNASIISVTGASPICVNGTTTYTANGVVLGGGTGTWSSSNNAIATVNWGGLVTGMSGGSCNIIYTINGGCGGTVFAQKSVTITPIPTATISYAGNPFCITVSTPQPVTLNGTGTYTGGTFSSTTGLTLNTVSGAITPSTSTAGTYIVTYTIPASGGCSSVPVTTTVTIDNLPTVNVTPKNPTICPGDTLNIRSHPSGGQLPYTSIWTGSGSVYLNYTSNNQYDNDKNPVFSSNGTTGSYQLVYHVTDGDGCTNKDSTIIHITDNAAPTFTFCPGPQTVNHDPGNCAGAEVFGPIIDNSTLPLIPQSTVIGADAFQNARWQSFTSTYTGFVTQIRFWDTLATTNTSPIWIRGGDSGVPVSVPYTFSLYTGEYVKDTAYNHSSYEFLCTYGANLYTTTGTANGHLITINIPQDSTPYVEAGKTYMIYIGGVLWPISMGANNVSWNTTYGKYWDDFNYPSNPNGCPGTVWCGWDRTNSWSTDYKLKFDLSLSQTKFSLSVSDNCLIKTLKVNPPETNVYLCGTTTPVTFTTTNLGSHSGTCSFNLTVNPIPQPIITGPTPVCTGSTGNVYSTASGMSNYTWTVSSGGAITAGGGTANNI